MANREHLAAVAADRNNLQNHVWRARITLATAILHCAEISKPCVWRWQERLCARYYRRAPQQDAKARSPLASAPVDYLVELTLAEPPGEATQLTGRAMAADQRPLAALGAAHLSGVRSAAALAVSLKAFAGSGLCRQAARCRRALSRPTDA
jgi:hypothetical protein